ncbi:MAG: glycosyltransferase family 2 protein [Actinomycetota bacterium]
MLMSPVSVVIPTYNHARFLRMAIDSALRQSLPPREVIVIDDGSSDGTPEVVAEYGDRIRALRHANQGVAASRNAGAELATGKLLAFLDADDVWRPQKLERQVERFQREPGLGLVHCGVEEIDAEGNVLRRQQDGLEGSAVAREMLLFRSPTILGGGSGVMIARSAFDEVGGFDPRLSTSADWDLYFRLASRCPVGYVPEPLLQYRLHGSNMHGNIGAMERDMLLAYSKAFADPSSPVQNLRRRAYGNLHSVLAGSYFSVGRKQDFVRHAARSLYLTPDNLLRFAGYPLRLLRRKLTSQPNA